MKLFYFLGPSQLRSHNVLLFLRNLVPLEFPGGMCIKLTEQLGFLCKKLTIILAIYRYFQHVHTSGVSSAPMMEFDAYVHYVKI